MFRTARGVNFLALASSLVLLGGYIIYEAGGIDPRKPVLMPGSKSKMLGLAVRKSQEPLVSAATEGVAAESRDEPKPEDEPE